MRVACRVPVPRDPEFGGLRLLAAVTLQVGMILTGDKGIGRLWGPEPLSP